MINGMAACSLSYMAGLYGVYGVSDRVSGLLQGNEIFPQMWLQFCMAIFFFFLSFFRLLQVVPSKTIIGFRN